MDHAAGEPDDDALRVDPDHRLKLEFHGSGIMPIAAFRAARLDLLAQGEVA